MDGELKKRVPEPEVMDDLIQAEAYAGADFEEPHGRVLELFEARFPGLEVTGPVLDLGCGPGDVTLRFARRYPGARILGVDGSGPMIRLAERAGREGGVNNVSFIKRLVTAGPMDIPGGPYPLIVSTSFLHHLHDPGVLWSSVKRYSAPGGRVFVVDLYRPCDRGEAARLVEQYSADEPEVLRKDFFNSLLAAFTPDEVRGQLKRSGLAGLKVEVVSDRHMVVYGAVG